MTAMPAAVREPCAWLAADLQADRSWAVPVSEAQRAELSAAVAAVRARGLRAADFGKADFPLPAFGAVLARAQQDLEHGRGCVLLRGLPVTGDAEDAARLLWGLGLHLGRALRQHARVNVGGFRDDLIAHIVDQGLDYNAPNVHGSATSAEQMPHTDPADVVGLLCVRKAEAGGVSRIASATAVYHALLAARPDLVRVLEIGYAHDLRQLEATGDTGPLTPARIPVFGAHEGRLACVYNSKTVLAAAKKSGVPLTALEREALEAVSALALDPGFQVEMTLEPCDLQLLNNYTVLHSRTAWTDPDPAHGRLMLRLWLKVPNARALSPVMAAGYSYGTRYDVSRQAATAPRQAVA